MWIGRQGRFFLLRFLKTLLLGAPAGLLEALRAPSSCWDFGRLLLGRFLKTPHKTINREFNEYRPRIEQTNTCFMQQCILMVGFDMNNLIMYLISTCMTLTHTELIYTTSAPSH